MKEYFYSVLEKAFQLKNKKLSNPKSPEALKKEFDFSLNDIGEVKNLNTIIDEIFKHSVNTQNPRFLNQLYGGSTQISWLGELITAVLNTSMATYEIAPLATLMEQEIIHTINKELGFNQVAGLIVPGGSYANMLGIHLARYHQDPKNKDQGLYGQKKYKVFVSKDAHYSSEKSLNLLGLGTQNLVLVDTDVNHKMDIQDLVSKILKTQSEGDLPLCILSTAGTTVWGSFDPISEIQEVAKEYKLWHHVDAAWGGLALWSEKKQSLFKDIHKVDSITLDFHKLMASTLTKGIFLTSHPEVLKNANSGGGREYIFHDPEAVDTGLYAIQCGRKVDSLPLWLQWKVGGTVQFTSKARELNELKTWLEGYFQDNQDKYKLLLKPEFMNFCFQVLPKDSKENISDYNLKLRSSLLKRGNFMVNYSSDQENGYFFRLVFNHWDVSKDILLELFDELTKL